MSAFSVFGNPIKHSKSPEIYSIFAKEFSISQKYTRVLAFWMNFDHVLKNFFYLGGVGANITMPFKERAFLLCDKLTSRASISGSVNVIKKEVGGRLLGDNTDGIGLLSDLNRLQWLTTINSCNKENYEIKILLLGAGGAARGIITSLLDIGCQIEIVNRTLSRAQRLVDDYQYLGKISLAKFENQERNDISFKYDLIINATNGFWVYDQKPILPVNVITPYVSCYDISYQINKDLTPFISWCRENGARNCSDGLGMLVGQAAYSFLLWHGVFPSINSALYKIK